MRFEHVVAEVDLVVLEPGAVVIEVDPTDDISIHDDARGRLRFGRSLTEEREELSITSCHENRDILTRRATNRDHPVCQGLFQHDRQSALDRQPTKQRIRRRRWSRSIP